ncbi:hypothetical protein D7W82_24565 [Corallococcus sp. CA049B]|nr:hypothetical protein D7W82_24565 [Corallococcus sp. CA049B]
MATHANHVRQFARACCLSASIEAIGASFRTGRLSRRMGMDRGPVKGPLVALACLLTGGAGVLA